MISIISMFLELLLDQFIPKYLYMFPLFTLVSIFFLKKKNYIFLFILGLLYDLFFSEIVFFHSIIFMLLGLIKKNNIFIIIITITIYQFILFLFNNMNIKDFLFVSSHYYLLNIIYYYILRIIYKYKS